ncbi:MAG: hypothetical protein FGM32_11535 [Candidatus Kapabacteria bacterium]|nr:hypothetical protein [Candidatus Kapabacteria bacterium]
MSAQVIALYRLKRNPVVDHVASRLNASVAFTQYSGHAIELAANLPPDTSLVVAAGGDGTVSEVVNGLMRRPREQRPPLLIVPYGSGNDTARTIGARGTLADIDRRIDNMATVEWDVMKIDLLGPDSAPSTRYGINAMSVGVSAEVLRFYNRALRVIPARFGYVVATLLSFVRYRQTYIDIQLDNAAMTKKILLVAVANCKWFGAGICVAPDAVPYDNIVDVTVAEGLGVLDFLRLLPRLRRPEPIVDPGLQYHTTTKVFLRPSAPLAVEVDGEFAGFGPASISIMPKAVTLIA